jgi:hypothetical protein
MPPGGETQMVRSTHAAYFNIKLVRQQMVGSRSEVCTNILEHKIRSIRERGLLYGTYIHRKKDSHKSTQHRGRRAQKVQV